MGLQTVQVPFPIFQEYASSRAFNIVLVLGFLVLWGMAVYRSAVFRGVQHRVGGDLTPGMVIPKESPNYALKLCMISFTPIPHLFGAKVASTLEKFFQGGRKNLCP